MHDHLEVDGAMGEGGGQVLRSALTLSLLTGTPIRIRSIRRHRRRPGLQPQHLAAVRAAAAVSRARVEGMRHGSGELVFEPGPVVPGEYDFDIGTAGATALVLQTVHLPLALAGGPSEVTVHGGTHVPMSPCYHYLDRHWGPMLARTGLDLRLALVRAGFWPRGGGAIHAGIAAAGAVSGLDLRDRGPLLAIEGVSATANLPAHVAERQHGRALHRLHAEGLPAVLATERLDAVSAGTVLLLLLRFRRSRACFFALGARGRPAERVADEAVDQALGFLSGDGAVDAHLADQLLLPLSVARSPSRLRTAEVTTHLTTNAAVIRRFLPGLAIGIEGAPGEPGTVVLDPGPDAAPASRR